MSNTVTLTEGDLLAHQTPAGEVIQRVVAVDKETESVSVQTINSQGPIFQLPFSLVMAGLKSQAFGLYVRHAVSQL